MQFQRHEDALVCYERSLALDAGFAPAWFHQGMALRRQQQSREALADPWYVEAWYRKSNELWLLGDYHAAVAAYERTLTLDPNHHEAQAQALAKALDMN